MRIRRIGINGFVFLGLLVSVAANVALGVLLFRIDRSSHLATLKSKGVAVGTIVPPVVASRLDGTAVTLGYRSGDKPTLIYVFSPSCVWCARNAENLRVLLRKASSSYRLVGIAMEPSVEIVRQYLGREKIEMPVYVRPEDDTVAAYGFYSTPDTIVVSPEGRVVAEWRGAYVGAIAQDVERVFGLTLPGVR